SRQSASARRARSPTSVVYPTSTERIAPDESTTNDVGNALTPQRAASEPSGSAITANAGRPSGARPSSASDATIASGAPDWTAIVITGWSAATFATLPSIASQTPHHVAQKCTRVEPS